MDFSWEQKVAALRGGKALQRDRKDALLGQKAPHPHFWDKFRFLCFFDPCDQNKTFLTFNEDKIEHMNEVDGESL